MVLEFICNFDPSIQTFYIRAEEYLLTPQVVVEAMGLDDRYPNNDRTVKDWIKDYPTEAEV